MSCGCGGECCKQKGPLAAVAGLAHIGARPSGAGLGFLFAESGSGDYWNGGGGGDYWEGDWYLSGGGGGDYWGFDDPFWDYDSSETVYRDTTLDKFLPSGAPNVPLASTPVPWWEYFLPNFGGSGGGGSTPVPNLPGYCPGGTYHPLDDPYACVPFPVDPVTKQPTQPRQTAPQQQPPKASAPKTSPQNPQPCPAPGRTDPNTGRCVCPQGLLYDANKRQCVPATTSNRLVAPVGDTDVPLWVWILGGLLAVRIVKK